ncbi:hypothetical protein STA3757_48490 (plasmid) [Stanieria sp. NIES-3757]|uniref:Mobilization protein n=1 Tax=Stanieria cyanosphaera (strain ATCC 29371 / PCC 7437) TaxID=111780 RepID=K9Y135_STAC7|nr:hypothetical protein [Stanieria cyanosphaera]AFZ38086.1 hypothetical protein Sta7437_4628 [Stanieria cyanosphaera PCC 7437]BAU67427.1 hypothetical protein STA3757_48490 [Stanieria sp. NIES-3757]
MTKAKQNYRYKKEFKAARIDLRATPTEKAELQLKAKASGMSLGKYLIATGLNQKSTRITPAIDKALYLELCRQGNNLDRLARLHNTQAASGNYSKLHPDDRAMLEKIYNLLRQTLNQLQGRKVN